MQPLVTVIVPVYNRADIVTRTLDSIYAQTARPLSLILVDNNSTDDSLQVIKEWRESHNTEDFSITVLSETKPGACAARNKGLAHTTTPYVMFFDSDDIMLPNHIESIISVFRSDPDIDIAGNDILHCFLSGKKRIFKFDTTLYSHIFHASFATPRFAARTSIIRQVGGWDEDIRGWNDYELGVRIHTKAHPRMVKLSLPPSTISYQQEESLTGTDFSSRPAVWEMALDRCTAHLSDGKHKHEVRYIELRRVILAAHYRREGSPESKRLFGEAMSREKNPLRRLFYRLAYHYTAAGGRGIAIPARWLL